MHISKLDLEHTVQTAASALLQASLTDALDLQAQLKQAHWNVKGRDFVQLHDLFDRLYEEVSETVDTLAERITTLGGVADGRVQTTVAESRLNEYPLKARRGDSHLRAIAAALGHFGLPAREAITTAVTIGDLDTADVFTQASRQADKLLWLVEAHLVDG